MTTKPILLWPKPRSDIALHLDREADDFSVIDTDYRHELQKLYKLRREIPIFDPYPGHVEHYREKVLAGKSLSPLLLLRAIGNQKVIIADGYHRLCAIYSYDEDAVILCKIA